MRKLATRRESDVQMTLKNVFTTQFQDSIWCQRKKETSLK